MVKRLLILNGIAILGAVLYHTTGWGFTAMFWWTDQYLPVQVPDFTQLGGAGYYFLRFIEQLVIFSIPAFLFVSGYFVAVAAGRSQKTIGWNIVRSRILTLVIPFVLWSVLILIAQILQGERYTPISFITTIILGRTGAPFYFVPVLVQLYLIAPFLVPLARQHWKLLLVVTFIIQSAVVTMRYALILPIDVPWLNPMLFLTRSFLLFGFVFWFCLGIVTGLHLDKIKPFLYQVRWVLLVGVVVFFVLGMVEWEILLRASGQEWIAARETIIDNFYAITFLGAFIAFDRSKIPQSGQLSQLGARSFGVYLVHSPVLEYSARLIYHFSPWLLASQFLLQPVLFALGLGIPLLLMAIVNRSPARKYYGYLFG